MEMPETQIQRESKELLSEILSQTFEADQETPFENLLEKIEYVKPCVECTLDEADQRVLRLLHTEANTQFQ